MCWKARIILTDESRGNLLTLTDDPLDRILYVNGIPMPISTSMSRVKKHDIH